VTRFNTAIICCVKTFHVFVHGTNSSGSEKCMIFRLVYCFKVL